VYILSARSPLGALFLSLGGANSLSRRIIGSALRVAIIIYFGDAACACGGLGGFR